MNNTVGLWQTCYIRFTSESGRGDAKPNVCFVPIVDIGHLQLISQSARREQPSRSCPVESWVKWQADRMSNDYSLASKKYRDLRLRDRLPSILPTKKKTQATVLPHGRNICGTSFLQRPPWHFLFSPAPQSRKPRSRRLPPEKLRARTTSIYSATRATNPCSSSRPRA